MMELKEFELGEILRIHSDIGMSEMPQSTNETQDNTVHKNATSYYIFSTSLDLIVDI